VFAASVSSAGSVRMGTVTVRHPTLAAPSRATYAPIPYATLARSPP